MARIISAISLPDSWQDRLLARLHLEDEVKRVEKERKETEQRMKRLGQVYLDNLLPLEEYQRQKRQLEEKLGSLVVPAMEDVQQAGNLLENLSQLWEEAELGERWKILQAMLESVYVDPVEDKSIVALRPKPAFQALFQIATTKEGSGVVLYNEKAPVFSESFDESVPCFWWRRGVQLHLKRTWRLAAAPQGMKIASRRLGMQVLCVWCSEPRPQTDFGDLQESRIVAPL
jgi:hypothetical protein